jgi:hypothetical protein
MVKCAIHMGWGRTILTSVLYELLLKMKIDEFKHIFEKSKVLNDV